MFGPVWWWLWWWLWLWLWFVELLILCELWAGERLSLEKAHPRYLPPGRPISVSAVPFGPGIDIFGVPVVSLVQ